jgi:transposase
MRKRRNATGPKHTVEFRQEAVRVALTGSLTRKQVAAGFGVGFSTLSRWVQQDRMTLPEPSVQSDPEKEVTMLRKENRLLREEREVLKKATIFFAGQKP